MNDEQIVWIVGFCTGCFMGAVGMALKVAEDSPWVAVSMFLCMVLLTLVALHALED